MRVVGHLIIEGKGRERERGEEEEKEEEKKWYTLRLSEPISPNNDGENDDDNNGDEEMMVMVTTVVMNEWFYDTQSINTSCPSSSAFSLIILSFKNYPDTPVIVINPITPIILITLP